MLAYEHVLLEVKEGFEDVLSKSQLPYLKLLYPQEVCKLLASKDGKFEKKYHLVHPVHENVSNKIKEFARYINGYEIYSTKNSKYYIE